MDSSDGEIRFVPDRWNWSTESTSMLYTLAPDDANMAAKGRPTTSDRFTTDTVWPIQEESNNDCEGSDCVGGDGLGSA